MSLWNLLEPYLVHQPDEVPGGSLSKPFIIKHHALRDGSLKIVQGTVGFVVPAENVTKVLEQVQFVPYYRNALAQQINLPESVHVVLGTPTEQGLTAVSLIQQKEHAERLSQVSEDSRKSMEWELRLAKDTIERLKAKISTMKEQAQRILHA